MPFTVISGGALGVDLEAEKLARHYGLNVEVLIPPCHPRRASIQPLTHQQLAEAIPTTRQVAARLNKNLENPISLQYIHRNYHVVEQADMLWRNRMGSGNGESPQKSPVCVRCAARHLVLV